MKKYFQKKSDLCAGVQDRHLSQMKLYPSRFEALVVRNDPGISGSVMVYSHCTEMVPGMAQGSGIK